MLALPSHAVLILTGDHNHLPPAGPGRVFYDLAASEQIPLISLKSLDMPVDFSSKAAYRISLGEMPDLPVFKPFELKEQIFYFIEQDNPEKIFKTIGSLYSKRLPKALGYGILDIQVMSLCKKGPVSAKKLNLFLQERLNKRTGGLKHNGFIFKVNDKVVQIAENHSKGLYVGQTGIIKDINMYKKELYVEFKDKHKNTYLFHELNELKLAYAMPISKSGLRKHTAIILPLHCDSYTNLNRTSLYSVFLTAGEMLIIVGQKRALKIALDTFKAEKRFTGLKELLLT